jgi:hypothetical protein
MSSVTEYTEGLAGQLSDDLDQAGQHTVAS